MPLRGFCFSGPAEVLFLFSFYSFIYLFEREKESSTQAGGAAEREEGAGYPLSRKPHVGPDPRTPR